MSRSTKRTVGLYRQNAPYGRPSKQFVIQKDNKTITKNMQYKIKNTAIKDKKIVTKKQHTHTQSYM